MGWLRDMAERLGMLDDDYEPSEQHKADCEIARRVSRQFEGRETVTLSELSAARRAEREIGKR